MVRTTPAKTTAVRARQREAAPTYALSPVHSERDRTIDVLDQRRASSPCSQLFHRADAATRAAHADADADAKTPLSPNTQTQKQHSRSPACSGH